VNAEQANYLITHVCRIADALEAIATTLYAQSDMYGNDVGDATLVSAFDALKHLGFASIYEEAEDKQTAREMGLIR